MRTTLPAMPDGALPEQRLHDPRSPDRRLARRMLDIAARAAMRSAGDVEPNPLVGCVIARGDTVLAIGRHKRFGGLHAEREALASCRARGVDPRGATMYVTLEPCRHFGKQPPCTEAVIEAGIARVIYAAPDPGKQSGGGAETLREAGVEAAHAPVSPLADACSEPFRLRTRLGRPWVIAKWAQTIDGRIATSLGESQWISGEGSRARVHRIRARVDAMLTGLGTINADDPLLTARGVPRVRRVARRVVIDPQMDLATGSAVVRTAGDVPTSIACNKELATAGIMLDKRLAIESSGVEIIGVPGTLRGRLDLGQLLETLWSKMGIATVLVEAGAGVLGSLLDSDLIDEAVVYIAPMLLGDARARPPMIGRDAPSLADVVKFELRRARRTGPDIELTYRRPPLA